ncbi:MAG: S41 family peptidase, partial [Alphaproteobacteria bacterium]|nr:S41 family peptidase [Alphaproteobacteria bacterium]
MESIARCEVAGRRCRAAVLSLALLALAACAAGLSPHDDTSEATTRLFTRAYDDVMDLYIEKLSAKEVAVPALAHLSSIDPDFSARPDNTDIVLRIKEREAERLPQPEARDARGWAKLTTQAIISARRLSPKIAETTENDVEKTLFSGITGQLDRFSRYLPPDAARDEEAAREGFGGIGITLDYSEEMVRVSTIIDGSPADQAGMKLDDQILEIDGTPASSLTREEIVRRLRGTAGSRLDLVVARAGEPQNLHKTLTRSYIVVPTVVARRDGTIAVYRITGFNEHTTDSLRDEIKKMRADLHGPPRGIVLDLRGNPGGLLNQAASVSDLFIPNGRIVATVGRNPTSNQEFDTKHGDVSEGVPMVVLVNGGSASSAEIVAAALQDSGRAVVVGSSSFGKGTVQIVERLPNEGELILTVARLITPAGYVLHEHGVVPNICTSGADDDTALATVLKRSATSGGGDKPRASLDEPGWMKLRGSCPSDVRDHKIEIEAAEDLITDPA